MMTRLRRALMSLALVVGSIVFLGWVADARPYPLDGYEETGIRRLLAYRLQIEGKMPGRLRLQPGALLPRDSIKLRLLGINDSFDISVDTPTDPALQEGLDRIVGNRHPSYRAALVDITDPAHPRYAAVRANDGYIPGSVAKLLVMTGLFNELQQLYPTDTAARAALLRNTVIVADRFVVPNSHQVPVVNEDMTAVVHRAVRVGDSFTLWEWVDHMVSPSSNAAGSMVWKHALLMDAFGHDYPPSQEQEDEFFRSTSPAELSERAVRVLEEPLLELGLDTAQLRQGTFFTRTASRVIPGTSSYATPSQLVRWMVKLEQGKVVDEWSSLEMKRLMYFTRRRYRYAASPALDSAAVFFKSGSLYQCRPEPGFTCTQYHGNGMNLMHSVAIVESPAGGPNPRMYLISMMSNVLKVNSAGEHAGIAALIERHIRTMHSDLEAPGGAQQP